MNFIKIYKLAALIVSLLLLTSAKLTADITTVTANNSPSRVSITSTGRSQLTWTVTETNTNGNQVTVQSPTGIFYTPDGDILGQNNVPLISTRITQIRTNTLYVFHEPLVIPLSVIRAAQQRGFSRLAYSRIFTDSLGAGSRVAMTTFAITGGTVAGALIVRRIQMEFDDGRTTEIVAPGAKLQARAIISYQGTGLLEYSWEIASPPSTLGKPVFVPVISHKQFLLAGDIVTLQSPNLHTELSGNYLVRLKISKLPTGIQLPVIRYSINSASQSRLAFNKQNISVSQPAADSFLTPDTNFSWQAVSGASAYQLEIFTRPIRDNLLPGIEKTMPLTGVLIPASKTTITIGKLPRTHLLPGTTYYWRVIAFSDSGQIIGRSDFRGINFSKIR